MSILVVFVVTRSTAPPKGELVGDVLFVSAPHGYRNIVYKVKHMMGLVRHIDFKFLLKADDDTFVCVERLAKFLHNQPEESKDKLYAGVPTFCKAETNAARNEYAGIKFARLEAGGAFSYGLTRDTKELIKWGPGEGAPAVLVENIP